MSLKEEKNNHQLSENIDHKNYDSLYYLSSEEEDNLYTLPDDYEINDDYEEVNTNASISNLNGLDSSRLNDGFGEGANHAEEAEDDESGIDNEEEENEEAEESCRDKRNAIVIMFKILSTPVEGWKEMKRQSFSPEHLMSSCFIPFALIASLSQFADKIYGGYIGIGECMMKSLAVFISFFFGYFTVILLGGILLPKSARHILKSEIGKDFIMMCFTTLCFFFTIMSFFPMLDAILVFLPIWTIYIIYKGVRFLRVPFENESRIKIVLSFLVIGSPLLWKWMIEEFFKI